MSGAAPPGDLTGRTIASQFSVLKKLGAGGMGAVYLAEQIDMGRKVVVKVMHPELTAGSPTAAERFKREARAVAALNHPNIVGVYVFGQTDTGQMYLAMEYVEGRDLTDDLKRGRLHQARALRVIDQVASALIEAHHIGIVHRDLKPDNIMLTDRHGNPDYVKVLDFGISKMMGDQAQATLTQAGAVFGTPRYMAPEQAKGQAIDARADLYAIGIILYEMLTGAHPFRADSALDYLMKHASEEILAPSRRYTGLEISPRVEQILKRCTEKDPARRFQSAAELQREVRTALRDFPDAGREFPTPGIAATVLPPQAPQKRSLTWLWITLAVLVIGGGAGTAAFLAMGGSEDNTKKSIVSASSASSGSDEEKPSDEEKASSTSNEDDDPGSQEESTPKPPAGEAKDKKPTPPPAAESSKPSETASKRDDGAPAKPPDSGDRAASKKDADPVNAAANPDAAAAKPGPEGGTKTQADAGSPSGDGGSAAPSAPPEPKLKPGRKEGAFQLPEGLIESVRTPQAIVFNSEHSVQDLIAFFKYYGAKEWGGTRVIPNGLQFLSPKTPYNLVTFQRSATGIMLILQPNVLVAKKPTGQELPDAFGVPILAGARLLARTESTASYIFPKRFNEVADFYDQMFTGKTGYRVMRSGSTLGISTTSDDIPWKVMSVAPYPSEGPNATIVSVVKR